MISPEPASASADLRKEPRQRVLLGGKLIYGDGRFTLDFMFRNKSPGGALIKLPPGQVVPDHFQLIEFRSGMAYDCVVARRDYPLLGVRITAEHDLHEVDTPHLRHLRRLWLDGQMR